MCENAKYDLIISPEYERLSKKLRELRAVIIDLILEKNELLYKKKPELINTYVRNVGKLELELSGLREESVRIKYITDMIRIRIQFKKEVDIEAIEKKAYEDRPVIFERTDTVKDIEEKKDDKKINKYEEEELKLIYRKVIKLLHPDLGADRTPAEERLLRDAIEAYEYRDVQALRSIASALEDSCTDVLYYHEGDILTVLTGKINLLYKRKTELEGSVKQIKSEFPFTYEKFLSDSVKVEKKQKKLESGIRSEQERLEKLKDRLRYYKMKMAAV